MQLFTCWMERHFRRLLHCLLLLVTSYYYYLRWTLTPAPWFIKLCQSILLEPHCFAMSKFWIHFMFYPSKQTANYVNIFGIFTLSVTFQLLGGEVYHYHSKMMLKGAQRGAKHHWHQDFGYLISCLYINVFGKTFHLWYTFTFRV